MATLIPSPSFSVVPDFQSNPFVSGYNLAVTGNTTLTVSPGCARALTSDFVIQYPSYSASLPALITVDISTVGANGCYPNSIESLSLTYNTLFPVYVCQKSSGTTDGSLNPGVNAVVVVATGDSFLPPGFDAFRRIGWVPVSESTGYILPFAQQGNGNEREYLYQDPVSVLSDGLEYTTPAEVNLSYETGMVPANMALKANLQVQLTGAADTSYVTLEPFGLTAGTASAGTVMINTPVASLVLGLNVDMVCGVDSSGNTAITYIVDSGSSVSIAIAGFTDSLANSLV